MAKVTREQRAAIEANKRNGLLCACNQAVVPYGTDDEHGHVIIQGIVHGYGDCTSIKQFVEYVAESIARAAMESFWEEVKRHEERFHKEEP